MSIKTTISKNIRKFRKELEATTQTRIRQMDVAQAIHKSRPVVTKFELGLQIPDAEELKLLADFFNRSVADFYN
jgi:transcriptional regulator with XRE-family HTH domain